MNDNYPYCFEIIDSNKLFYNRIQLMDSYLNKVEIYLIMKHNLLKITFVIDIKDTLYSYKYEYSNNNWSLYIILSNLYHFLSGKMAAYSIESDDLIILFYNDKNSYIKIIEKYKQRKRKLYKIQYCNFYNFVFAKKIMEIIDQLYYNF